MELPFILKRNHDKIVGKLKLSITLLTQELNEMKGSKSYKVAVKTADFFNGNQETLGYKEALKEANSRIYMQNRDIATLKRIINRMEEEKELK